MENLNEFYHRYLRYFQSKDNETATSHDKYMALAVAVRGFMVDKWIETQKKYYGTKSRRVYFLSTDYVFGKSLKQNVIALGLQEKIADVEKELDLSIEDILMEEDDFELGNTSVGNIAATFLETMATLNIPAVGYGLNYDYALYQQEIRDGRQFERPYDWLHKSHPWEIKRPEYFCSVGFKGFIEHESGNNWIPAEEVNAIPYDFPVAGYKNDTVNTLRLWSSEASEKFLDDYDNHKDYIKACEDKLQSGRVTKYLFPDENVRRANEMRIKQSFFFVSASLQDIIRRYKRENDDITKFADKVVIHIFGSKLAIAIPELMRLFVDVEGLKWDKAWEITKKVFVFTSQAVSMDNIESWPIYLIENVLPRHAKIIMDINQDYLDSVRANNNLGDNLIQELSLISEGEVKWLKFGHLAVLGSSVVTGTSKSQTGKLKNDLFNAVIDYSGTKTKTITTGLSFRRWVRSVNKSLFELISEGIGTDSWMTEYEKLSELSKLKSDSAFLDKFMNLKYAAKQDLSERLSNYAGLFLSSDTMYDTHCKKIHPCKRHVLQLMYIISQYLKIKDGIIPEVNRTHIFGGRASPSDFLAKQIVHLINAVVATIVKDSAVHEYLNVVFIPNYGITMSENVVSASELSEQISSPECEISGSTNMKFAINGSVTLASYSGSNIEMYEFMNDGMVMFGNKADGSSYPYDPQSFIESSSELQRILQFIEDLAGNIPSGNELNPLVSSLKYDDPYFILRDYSDYVSKQNEVDFLYKDKKRWASMSVDAIAAMGWFSSDRMVEEYKKHIWKVEP